MTDAELDALVDTLRYNDPDDEDCNAAADAICDLKADNAALRKQLRLEQANCNHAVKRLLAQEADNAALRQLLADMKPHWVGATRGSFSRELVALHERVDAALLAAKGKV